MAFTTNIYFFYDAGEEIKFSTDRDPNDRMCWDFLKSVMPENVIYNKIRQKLFIGQVVIIIIPKFSPFREQINIDMEPLKITVFAVINICQHPY